MTAPIVALDTETTGLSLSDDIWEFAGIRREPDGTETELHLFIEHDRQKCLLLPDSFRQDHVRRYPTWDEGAATQSEAANLIANFLAPRGTGHVHVVGAVPNFDTERLALLFDRNTRQPEWHYHLIDVENLAVGYLASRRMEYPGSMAADVSIQPPWKSDDLSRAVGVEPPGEGERHTAMGDARWALRLYDAITGGAA